MATIRQMLRQAAADGYTDEYAEAKVCQDVVLKAISESSLSRNATIKGGVVMRSISHNVRRATQDMDIDFIRYSLSDESIRLFIQKLNCIEDIHISQIGMITELKQQEYHGKRVHIEISDKEGDSIQGKIDLGVHKNISIDQEEYCFDISCFDDGANLLINSKEQIFAEKLKSILKFGSYSTRFKDIFDMCYLCGMVDKNKLKDCISVLIFEDTDMRENNMADIRERIRAVFSSDKYVDHLSKSEKNWMNIEVADVLKKITSFIDSL